MSIVLIVHLKVKEGTENEVESTFRNLAEISLKEPGCISFKVIRSRNNKKRYMFLEEYTNIDAALEHQHSSHYRSIVVDQILPKLSGRNIYLMDGVV